MWKLIVFCCLVAVCLSQTAVDLTIICKYVSILNCNLFANHEVCASNNITYDSHCMFSKAHCQDRNLHLTYNTSCSDAGHKDGGSHGSQTTYEFFCRNLLHTHCGTDMEIVCASDGKTYNNFCLFEKARCNDRNIFIKEYNACA
ncbi:agrin-like [Gigantopelta aegis]|uniref:agrin-like n=1 Tax=Gigantopelta aegis TaxID=1735272 RepID=UPI001B88DB8E|nr:agrin-like [Gigantopelta aegis]